MNVPTLVFLCLTFLRFPRNKTLPCIITERYGQPVLALFRKIEREDYRLKKLKCDLRFLQICDEHNLVPNFLKFKLSNRNLQHSKALMMENGFSETLASK